MAKNYTVKMYRGPKANLPTLGIGELALVTDEKVVYTGTETGNVGVSKNKVRGSDVTIASAGWVKQGNDYVVTITEPKLQAKTAFYEYQVEIAWNPASLKLIAGAMSTDTNDLGGTYTITLVADSAPQGNVYGQVTIEKVWKDW